MKNLIIVVALLSLLVGCSYTTGVEITPKNRYSSNTGIRYHTLKPILLVRGRTHTIEMIPNMDREYAIKLGAFLAKNESILKLRENGTFEMLDTKLDSTDVSLKLVDLIEKERANKSQSSSFVPPQVKLEPDENNELRVYDFVFDGTGNITALRQLGHCVDGTGKNCFDL